MLALVNNQSQPKILSLRHILDEYIAYQEEVIVRRTRYDLRKAQERAHLLEGLLIAQDNIDEVIRIIRTSYDNARENLMTRFELDEVQAQAICDMRLIALQGLNREKLQVEYDELMGRIAYFNELLASESMLREVLKTELTEIRDKFGDDRVTEIGFAEDDLDIEDLIEEENSVFTLTSAGYIKRLPVSTYKAQRRGGKGITAMATKEEDYVETVFTASTHDFILFFTNKGRVHRKKGYQIPEAGRTAKGTNLVNVLPIEPDEKVTAMIHLREFPEDRYLCMVTRDGTVKRIQLSSINTARKAGIRCITLDEGDELISVRETDGEQAILIATYKGASICFLESDVRCMGRDATGVRGIKLREGDYVIGATCAQSGCHVLMVTENGYGKRTEMDEYIRGDGPQNRGGYGLKGYNVTEKTGGVVGLKVVCDEDDLLIINNAGVIIRMAVKDVNSYSRTAQGVRVMNLDDGVKVISIALTDREEPEEESGEAETGE
jgi:DNA gyrase subunit A